MKKISLSLSLIVLLVSVFMMSCEYKVSDNLSTSNVKSLIEKDTLYEKLIPRILKIQDSISKNILLNAKFSDITYQQCLEYEKEKNKAEIVFIKNHTKDVDEKIYDLKNKVESFRNLMNISFHSTSIYFYKYNDGVEDGYFKFKISVTEPIQGGSFKYLITDKTTGKAVETGRCKFSENIKDHYIGMWKIPYDSKNEFGYQSVNEIKNRYNFDFTILSVYKDGELKNNSLSNYITLTSDVYTTLILKTLILKKFKINLYDSEYDLFKELNEDELYRLIIFYENYKEWNEICKKIDPLIFAYYSIL